MKDNDTLEEMCQDLLEITLEKSPEAVRIRKMLDVLRFHFPEHPVLPDSAEMKARRKAEQDRWLRAMEAKVAFSKARFEAQVVQDMKPKKRRFRWIHV